MCLMGRERHNTKPVVGVQGALLAMGRKVPKEDLPMLPQKPVPEPAWAVFDQFGDDRAAERERCRRRRDQSIVVLTAEARSPRPDG
jgi:hypothetical protein